MTEDYFANSIRSLRERRGMTQRQLATKARTSQSAIARMEAGAIDPRLSTMERICESLDAQLFVCEVEECSEPD